METLRNSKDYTEKNYIMPIEKVKSKYCNFQIFDIKVNIMYRKLIVKAEHAIKKK